MGLFLSFDGFKDVHLESLFLDTQIECRGPAYVKERKTFRQTLLKKKPRTYKHKRRTNRWANFKKDLDDEKWDEDLETSQDFVDIYFIFPRVVCALEDVISKRWGKDGKLNRFKTVDGTSLPIGDMILIAMKWLRSVQVPDIAETFGRKLDSTRSALRLSFKVLGTFGYVFGKNLGTIETVDQIKARLEAAGIPWPEAAFVGDATDIPIWTSDDTFYTYKRVCPSTHAIRVLIIIRRDTMSIVSVTIGAAPSGPMGSDTQMLLSSSFDAYARQIGMSQLQKPISASKIDI